MNIGRPVTSNAQYKQIIYMSIIAIPGFSEPFSSLTHLLAAGVAFVGLFYLCYKGRGNGVRLFALALFSFTLIFLFSMSGVYHLLDPEYLPRKVFQRLDHAAIWALIAGTFTPVHMILFRGVWRWGVLLVVWAIAISGLVLEVVFFNAIAAWMSSVFYLALGWIGILTSWHFIQQYGDQSIRLLWLGGLFYSLGAILELLHWPVVIPGVVGPHEIFHIFVIVGAFYHWRFVYHWAYYPTKNHLVFHVRVLPHNQYIANAVGELIRLEAHSLDHLREKIQQRIKRHFHENRPPKSVRLKYFSEEQL